MKHCSKPISTPKVLHRRRISTRIFTLKSVSVVSTTANKVFGVQLFSIRNSRRPIKTSLRPNAHPLYRVRKHPITLIYARREEPESETSLLQGKSVHRKQTGFFPLFVCKRLNRIAYTVVRFHRPRRTVIHI
jgi:hypothetical protein